MNHPRVEVYVNGGEMSEEEREKYIDYIQTKYNRHLDMLVINIDGEFVNLDYKFTPVCFERIRRITGYLTGDTSTWNDAKQRELDDRVVHGGMVNINEDCSCTRVEHPDGISIEEANRFTTGVHLQRGE